jgi:hypothetical protein
MLYLDTSALVKTVLEEAESAALRALVDGLDASVLWTSALTRTELVRAAARRSEEHVVAARRSLGRLTVVTITVDLLDVAGALAPVTLRSPNAIHVATALELGEDLEAVVTYDDRTADAARHHGLAVLHPGQPSLR